MGTRELARLISVQVPESLAREFNVNGDHLVVQDIQAFYMR